MENQASPAAEERRSSARVKDRFPLFVRGLDAFDSPFSEMTEVNDISQGGISFFVQSPVWVDSVVNISIGYLDPEKTHSVFKRKAKARVLRVDGVDMGQHFVVACFEDED